MTLVTSPYIVAHRGVHSTAHENTLAAFEEAILQGVDFIECDIRRTADGISILHHDEAVGASEIATSSLAELQHAGFTLGYQINTLADLLSSLHGRVRVDFELKEQGYEVAFLNQLAAAGWQQDSFVITSFNDASITAIKSASPTIRCGLLLGCDLPEHPLRTRFNELFPVHRLRSCGADFAAPNLKLLKLGFLQRVTSAGFPVWVWTVNRPQDLAKLTCNTRIEAVITDVPQLAIQQRAQSRA